MIEGVFCNLQPNWNAKYRTQTSCNEDFSTCYFDVLAPYCSCCVVSGVDSSRDRQVRLLDGRHCLTTRLASLCRASVDSKADDSLDAFLAHNSRIAAVQSSTSATFARNADVIGLALKRSKASSALQHHAVTYMSTFNVPLHVCDLFVISRDPIALELLLLRRRYVCYPLLSIRF